jgi:hypothetical protein
MAVAWRIARALDCIAHSQRTTIARTIRTLPCNTPASPSGSGSLRRLSLRGKCGRRAAAGTTDDDGEDSNGVPATDSHFCAKAWRRHTWLHRHSTAAGTPGNMARIWQRVLPEHATNAICRPRKLPQRRKYSAWATLPPSAKEKEKSDREEGRQGEQYDHQQKGHSHYVTTFDLALLRHRPRIALGPRSV